MRLFAAEPACLSMISKGGVHAVSTRLTNQQIKDMSICIACSCHCSGTQHVSCTSLPYQERDPLAEPSSPPGVPLPAAANAATAAAIAAIVAITAIAAAAAAAGVPPGWRSACGTGACSSLQCWS